MTTTRLYSPYDANYSLRFKEKQKGKKKKTQIIAMNLVMVLLEFKERINVLFSKKHLTTELTPWPITPNV